MTIIPLSDRVLIEPIPAEKVSAGGVIIPGSAKEKPQKGIVIAVGEGRNGVPLQCEAGDTVLYGKYAGTEVESDGKTLLMMRESELFAKIK
jgi:chaperonin GroES